MGRKPPEPTFLADAERAFSKAKSTHDLVAARSLGVVAREDARQNKSARAVLLKSAQLVILIEHAIGTALKRTGMVKGAPGKQHIDKRTGPAPRKGPQRPRDLGLRRSESIRTQLIASLSRRELNRWLASCLKEGREPTLRGVVLLAKEVSKSKEAQPPRKTPRQPIFDKYRENFYQLQKLVLPLLEKKPARVTPAQGAEMKRLMTAMNSQARKLVKENAQSKKRTKP